MLSVALGLFTIVAVFGLLIAKDIFVGKSSSKTMRFLHVCVAAAGSGLVIAATFMGDHRLWITIGLAVAVIALGLMLWHQRSKRLQVKGLVIMHGSMAVICYMILAYFVFTPR